MGKAGKASRTSSFLLVATFVHVSMAHALPFDNNGTFTTHSGSGIVSPTSSVGGNSTAGALQSCLQNLSPVFPNSQNYGQDSAPFNQAFSWKPAVIVYPQSTNDVAQAVKCAASSGYKVSARAGGHSYAAFGLGGENGQVIISLDKMAYSYVDSSTGVATIGAGTRLGPVALGLWEGGKRAMPHGTCAYVGSGGHFAMGGWGLDSRLWGLAMDNVEAITLVKADGSVSTVSSSNDPNLYWAMRGAAPSFAIATEFKAKTYQAPPEVYHFELKLNLQNAKQAAQAFLAYVNWGTSATIPAELGMQLELGKNNFVIEGTYYGANGDSISNKTIASLLASLPVQPTQTNWKVDYITAVKMLTGNPNASLNVTGTRDSPDTFFATALFVQQENLLTEQAVQSFFNYIYGPGLQSNTRWFIQTDIWGGQASAINQVGQQDTSFWVRDAAYAFQFYASTPNFSPPYPQSDIDFVQGFKNSITSQMPGVTFYGYANYVDATLSASEAQSYYYGGHAEKLNQIKSQVDPNGVFTNPQAFGRQ